MKTLESVERLLDRVLQQHNEFCAIAVRPKYKDHYCDSARKLLHRKFPQLEQDCRDVIDACGIHTERHGFSDLTDYLKDRAFMVLGKCIGVNLDSNEVDKQK